MPPLHGWKTAKTAYNTKRPIEQYAHGAFEQDVCMFISLFVCLFWGVFRPNREIFFSYGDDTIAGEGLQILTYARYSWPLSSEGSLACHTHYDTGHLFIMVISEDPWHSHLLHSVWQWSCHYLFYDLGLSRLGLSKMNLYRTTTVVTEDLGFSGLLRKRTKKIIFRALEISVCWKRHFVAF